MEYISIVMNEDAAYECLVKVGKLGAIQFTDVSLGSYCAPFFVRVLERVTEMFQIRNLNVQYFCLS